MIHRPFLLIALLVVGTLAAHSQTLVPADVMQSMREASSRLDYNTAEQRARDVLAAFEQFSPDQLVEAYTTLGVVLHTRNEPLEARRQFEAALSLNPGLELDSVLVSPKTLELFASIRRPSTNGTLSASPPTVRYVVLEDRRAGAALRSAVLPGWGQFHKENRARGLFYAVGAGLGTAGILVSHVARRQARKSYLSATAPLEIERNYDTYNNLHKVRAVAFGVTASIWTASVADALISGRPEPERRSVVIAPAENGTGLSLRVRL